MFQYIPGNINLILSSPHGGSLQPEDMNYRLQGCYDKETDKCNFNSSIANCDRAESKCRIVPYPDVGTHPIARAMADIIEGIVGKPHLVLFHLHRLVYENVLV